jgi:hypothetical protein
VPPFDVPVQLTVAAWKASTQSLLLPVQRSPASSSQVAPWETPMQLVELAAKASAGQAPDEPVQDSATSHWPAEARHSNVDALKASLQKLLVPLQRSAASSSHVAPWEAPMQLVVTAAKASAGHAPEDPVQDSATSH